MSRSQAVMGVLAGFFAACVWTQEPAPPRWPAPDIVPETGTSLYGGRAVTFRVRLPEGVCLPVRIAAAIVVDGRTLQRRETEGAASAGTPPAASFTFDLPALKPGVAMLARIEVNARSTDGRYDAKAERSLWLFGDCPFADQATLLSRLEIAVFDPSGDTIRTLRGASIPFEELRSLDEMEALRQGVVIVGEGLSLVQTRGLAESMVAAAGRGVRVLCLSPTEGALSIPGLGGDGASRSIRFEREDAILALDKRLDAGFRAWKGPSRTRGMRVAGQRDRFLFEVADEPAAWPWIDVALEGGSLIVCGFPVIAAWEAGPTAPYLLLAILQNWDRQQNPNREDPP